MTTFEAIEEARRRWGARGMAATFMSTWIDDDGVQLTTVWHYVGAMAPDASSAVVMGGSELGFREAFEQATRNEEENERKRSNVNNVQPII
jgi:hypothetical protein